MVSVGPVPKLKIGSTFKIIKFTLLDSGGRTECSCEDGMSVRVFGAKLCALCCPGRVGKCPLSDRAETVKKQLFL